MAGEWKNRRYFKQYNHETSSYVTFASVEDAQTKIGFGSCFDTSSPVKSYDLQDSGQTLVVTYALNSKDEINALSAAIDAAWADGSIFTGNTRKTSDGVNSYQELEVRISKFEYLTPPDGVEVQHTENFT